MIKKGAENSLVAWILMGICFVAVVGFVGTAPRLASFGLTNSVYLLVLLPLALTCALLLFQALKSSASVTSHLYATEIKLGGPPAVFVLVFAIGVMYGKPVTERQLIVRVNTSSESSLRVTEGDVTVDLGKRRQIVPIGPQGEAVFNDVAVAYFAKPVRLTVSAKNFAPFFERLSQLPEDGIVYVALQPQALRKVHGTVLSRLNQGPIEHAIVTLAGYNVHSETDAFGNFAIEAAAGEDSSIEVVVLYRSETVYREFLQLREPLVLHVNARP